MSVEFPTGILPDHVAGIDTIAGAPLCKLVTREGREVRAGIYLLLPGGFPSRAHNLIREPNPLYGVSTNLAN
jgi:hypothetical protein